MKLHLWGTDFRRSTAEMRAKLFCAPQIRAEALQKVITLGFTDLVYLYTCNRIEFFTTAGDYFRDTRGLWVKTLEHFGLPPESYYQGYHLEGKSALRHLMRVACSLESLVVGEPQILGQLKEAVRFSQENAIPVDKSLERCFQLAFATAKDVRTQTSLGEKPVSVATLGLQHLEALEGRRPLDNAVLVGRSPIMILIAQWLRKQRPGIPLLWVNRTPAALDKVEEARGVARLSLEQFLDRPPAFSHLFTATSANVPLFGRGFFEKVENAPLVFDFAEPPDVDRADVPAGRAEIFHLEDFREEASRNAAFRAKAVEQSEHLIEGALREFCLEQKEAPLLKDFSSVEPEFFQELSAALLSLEGQFPDDLQPKLKRWAEKLVKRHLHVSREHLRKLLRSVTEPDFASREML